MLCSDKLAVFCFLTTAILSQGNKCFQLIFPVAGWKSWLIFNMLNANGTWLQQVDEWYAHRKYLKMKDCLHNLKLVNDLAEQCIKDIQEYTNLVKDSQYQKDILIVVVDH